MSGELKPKMYIEETQLKLAGRVNIKILFPIFPVTSPKKIVLEEGKI